MRKALLFAAITAIACLYSCQESGSDDNVLQISEDDVIVLDGDFDHNFLSSWEYIVLDDKENDAIVPGDVNRILYDDGLYFIGGVNNGGFIKVFDSNGHYMNEISQYGRARNEYHNLREWTIDRIRNEVLITTRNDYLGPISIKKFDYQGNFLGESETVPLGEGTPFNNLIKCLSDGTLLVENGYAGAPIYDYVLIPQNGEVRHPFEMTGYRSADKGASNDESQEIIIGTCDVFTGSYDQLSDTTYTIRLFDNHIYRITQDHSECAANLAFRPQMTKKDIKNFNPVTSISTALPHTVYEMKDYLFIWYWNQLCVYEKSTSKVYDFHNYGKQLLPDWLTCSFYSNDMIACVSVQDISRANSRMESDDYDHSYSSELEDFYRKVKDCQNPVIFIAHYDKK